MSSHSTNGRACLRVLQDLQQIATLLIECEPPRETGSRWSTDFVSAVNSAVQYGQDSAASMRAVRTSLRTVPSLARMRAAALDLRCPFCFSGLECFQALLTDLMQSEQRESIPDLRAAFAGNSAGGLATPQMTQVDLPVNASSLSLRSRSPVQHVFRRAPSGVRGQSARRVSLPHAAHAMNWLPRSRDLSFDFSISLCRDGVMCPFHRSAWQALHVDLMRPYCL